MSQCVPESFADLLILNDTHIRANKSPSSIKPCLTSPQSTNKYGYNSSPASSRNSTSSFNGSPASSKRKVSFASESNSQYSVAVGVSNRSRCPIQSPAEAASFINGATKYTVSTKVYDGCCNNSNPTPLASSSSFVTTKDYDGCSSTSYTCNNQGNDYRDNNNRASSSSSSLSSCVSSYELTSIVDRALQHKFEKNAYVKVIDLPLRDGYYTGVIDRKARPHGKGIWVMENNEKVIGWWHKGGFIPNEYIARAVDKLKGGAEGHCGAAEPSSKSPTVKCKNLGCHTFNEGECNGFRSDYRLGEFARSPSHMINDPTSSRRVIRSLKKLDFAFIKRSCGSFSYAVIVDRYYCSVVDGEEEVLVFMVNSSQSTKSFPERLWKSFIAGVCNCQDVDGLDLETTTP